MINAAVVGASGYTGVELVKLLDRHPAVEQTLATSESHEGISLQRIFPTAPAIELIPASAVTLSSVDVLFLCLPHGVAAPLAAQAVAAGVRVVDLSADFRISERATYEKWYATVHPAPELLAEAVYGLTEFSRDRLGTARLVANPGCYPTSILLALQPIIAAGATNTTIIADAKSGVSGAGRAPRQHTHFVEVASNFSPYKIGRAHRHLPEMEQQLRRWQPSAPPLLFAPHLLPVPRGILSTIYVTLDPGWDEERVRALYTARYSSEPFVHFLPAGDLPSLAHANYTNRCVLGLTFAGETLILTSAIDNLLKGAAGQAVQNMNIMFGLDERTGLPA
jgi:N-acetyl-gamma-glutamyl-phosphate reductase